MVEVRALTGAELEAHLDDVARLRIAVFRDWPYLYDGTLDYERAYLTTYRDNPGALLVGAFDAGLLVGASTSTFMEDHAEGFAAPLRQMGLPAVLRSVGPLAKPDSITVPFSVSTLMAAASTILFSTKRAFTRAVMVASST